jgi:hypothetical protein
VNGSSGEPEDRRQPICTTLDAPLLCGGEVRRHSIVVVFFFFRHVVCSIVHGDPSWVVTSFEMSRCDAVHLGVVVR